MTSPADAERGVDANSDYEYWCHRTSIYDISHATKAFYAGWHARDLLAERLRQQIEGWKQSAQMEAVEAERLRQREAAVRGLADYWDIAVDDVGIVSATARLCAQQLRTVLAHTEQPVSQPEPTQQQEVLQAMGAAYAREDRRGRPVQTGLINGA